MPPLVEASQLSIGYGDRVVARQINLSVQPGEMIGIVGPNGCGKSTLLRTLAGAIPPISGSLTMGGDSLARLADRERARLVGYMGVAESCEFPFSVRETVMLGRLPWHSKWKPNASDQEKVDRAIQQVDLSHLVDRPYFQLSAGERQRAAFARLLAQDPELMLFDEPTAHQDPAHGVLLAGIMRELAAKGKSILVVAHDLPWAFLHCPEVIIFDSDGALRRMRADADETPYLLRTAFNQEFAFPKLPSGHQVPVPQIH